MNLPNTVFEVEIKLVISRVTDKAMPQNLVQMNVHLPANEKQELQKIAKELGLTTTFIVRHGAHFYSQYLLKHYKQRK